MLKMLKCSESLVLILLLPSAESWVLPESSAELSLAQGRAHSPVPHWDGF